jgi:hypothetical protein
MTKEHNRSHFRAHSKAVFSGATGKHTWLLTLSFVFFLLHSGTALAAKKKGAAEPAKKGAAATAKQKSDDDAAKKKSDDAESSVTLDEDAAPAKDSETKDSEAKASGAEETAKAAEETPDQPSTFANALFSAFAGLDFGGRQMHYTDRITNDNLRPYDLPTSALLPVAPGLAAAGEVFPVASKPWPVARDLGLSGKVNYNFASSKIGTETVSTTWFSWELNLRGRLLLGAARSAPLIGIELGTGQQVFKFHSADTATALILPSVDYRYIRVGADGRIPIGSAAVLVGLGYRHLSSSGQLGRHFPHADISSLDLKLGGALQLSDRLEARVLLNYARYSATLHAAPTDLYRAGGAVDQLLNLDVGVAAHF